MRWMIFLLAAALAIGAPAGAEASAPYEDAAARAAESLREGVLAGGSHPMLRSYTTDAFYLANTAFSYDNALSALALLAAGEDAAAAKLLDSFVYAVGHDRHEPGCVRNAYAAGNISTDTGDGGTARLPGWYTDHWCEDAYQVGCNTGNTAWVALALLQYDARHETPAYVDTAAQIMGWVIDHCTDGAPGFTAGFEGWPENGSATWLTYKSTEHNLDALAAFGRLAARTGEARWAEAADSARAFVQSMYDPDADVFRVGTLPDGVTPSDSITALDAQVWACLALGADFAPYEACLKAVPGMRTPEGGCAFCAEEAEGGWWSEGTAFTALMYRLRGEGEKAEPLMALLLDAQLPGGRFPAASTEHLLTGLTLTDGSAWEYGTAAHIAPTAWFVMAVKRFNPYAF